MADTLRVVLCGACGKMGRTFAGLAKNDARFKVVAGIDFEAFPESFTFPVGDLSRLRGFLADADVLVDFSAPEAAIEALSHAAEERKPAVIGTTGFSEAQRSRIEAFSKANAILLSANMSLGMNLMLRLAFQAAAALPAYDAALCETHHSQKKDAPSGSALKLAEAVRSARKDSRPVQIASLRLADVTGEHTLTLAGPCERIEITHRVHSREIFARGAVEAAVWMRGRSEGLYSMSDVLGP
jgi:4-hydroxy-tetrahydrodipicolinate reductase